MNIKTYECSDCMRIVDDDEVYHRREVDREEFWGSPVDRVSITPTCPYCGGEELEEVRLCSKCDLNVAKEDDDWCDSCLGEFAKEPDTLDPWMDTLSAELKEMGP